jgi:tetratricopeptide (TPR) repeat protein
MSPSPAIDPAADPADYYNLGNYNRPITTTSPLAQTWFNRGLIWSYAFNHSEASTCFSHAIHADPGCATAYWGLAFALGPNYNKPWEFLDESEVKRAIEAAGKAKELVDGGRKTGVERALIEATGARYHGEEGRNEAYASAMSKVYTSFPSDLDVATLYADALMNLTPWALWSLTTGLPAPGARTLEIKSVLERALSQPKGLMHPGLLHLYIHLMEMSPTPETALPYANHLRGLVPDAGHLEHMPTHIDILCGDYASAISSNSAAIRADEKYFAREEKGGGDFYTLYRAHNYHFKIYAAMFAGQSKLALETVKGLEGVVTDELLRTEMVDLLEGFGGVGVHVLVRFGRWKEILRLEVPEDRELYCVTTAMVHYGKGVAFAATGKIQESEKEREVFRNAVKRVPDSRTLFNNKCIDILAIAGPMLDGELEYRRGEFDAAFEHLRRAIKLDDELPYDEPWGWMQPTRHAYGALLLEQGKVQEAVKVYSADLGIDDTLTRALRHPNNVWSLTGYHECLVRLGRINEAKAIEPQLKRAATEADIPIKSSCFCRLSESKYDA